MHESKRRIVGDLWGFGDFAATGDKVQAWLQRPAPFGNGVQRILSTWEPIDVHLLAAWLHHPSHPSMSRCRPTSVSGICSDWLLPFRGSASLLRSTSSKYSIGTKQAQVTVVGSDPNLQGSTSTLAESKKSH